MKLILALVILIATSMESNDFHISYKGQDIYITPKGEKYSETLIFLHGLGDTAKGWLGLFSNKNTTPCLPTTKVVLLTAPIASVTTNKGAKMTSWFDIKIFAAPLEQWEESISVEEAKKNTESIQVVLNEEIKLLNGNSKKVMIGGFSQGCAMALNAGLQLDKPIGGVLGWSGYLFLLANGLEDGVIPFIKANKSFEKLNAEKHSIVRLTEKGLAHSINQNVLDKSASFIKKCFEINQDL